MEETIEGTIYNLRAKLSRFLFHIKVIINHWLIVLLMKVTFIRKL